MLLSSNLKKIPRHIAIVMDGNGRWAKKRLLPRAMGHKAGYSQARALVRHCGDLGVEAVTLYTFSTENWKRPEDEVSFLMGMYAKSLRAEAPELHQNNVQVKIIGDILGLPEDLQKASQEVEQLTQANTGLKLRLALNYGSRWEITQAAKNFAQDVLLGHIQIQDLTENNFKNYLQTHDCPEVDLLIRTSGVIRISNYLLFQIAYAELYFTDILFPDFSPDKLDQAIIWFSQQERRFGQISEQLK